MADIRYPAFAKGRGVGFWLHFGNLLASRRKMLRIDNSNEWRYTFGDPEPIDRSVAFSSLLDPEHSLDRGFRFIIIGDTGEGDRSQYGLVPLIRALNPNFMIINGDIAYPAGRIRGNERDKDDYLAGFFEPYRDLNIPIWSVPGNHEYYASGHGREYYDTFCTRIYADRWTKFGLRLVPQPGTYWELNEPDPNISLVVIGIDTGKAGYLDGLKRPWRTIQPDHKQYIWLKHRLEEADKAKKDVMVLFHIPALSRAKHHRNVRLKKLYQIIASHSCVKFVVCGHDHNHQEYSSEIFRSYLEHEANFKLPSDRFIYCIISGGGGAYLTTTDFKLGFWEKLFRHKYYQASNCFPSPAEWHDYARWGREALDKLGLSKTAIGKAAGIIEKDALSDVDAAQLLSFLLVDVSHKEGKFSYSVKPVFLKKLNKLFDQCAAINKTLKEVRMPEETGMWVLAIKRGEKSLRPKPDTKIQIGDILIASGYAEGVEDLQKLASPRQQCENE